MRLTLLRPTAQGLDQLFHRIEAGELSIGQLPLEVEQFISLGWAEGKLLADQQVRDYEHRLDLAHLAAYSPKDRAAEYQRRLDQHFRLEEQRFFAVEEESNNDSNNTRAANTHQHQRAA